MNKPVVTDVELLQYSEELYRSIFENNRSVMLVIDPETGAIIDANRAATGFYGWSREVLLQKRISEIITRSKEALASKIALSPTQSPNTVNFTHCLADGSLRDVEVYSDPVSSGGRNLLIMIVQDITDRKTFEKKLNEKNSELELFTYTVSHDLKSPLITIMTFVGYMLKDLETGRINRLEGDLTRVADAAGKMGMMLDNLLELSRIGRTMNPPDLLDMGQLVNDVLTRLSGRIEQHQVQVTVQTGLPGVYGDRQRIVMVLQNLVENAVKFPGDQTALRIEVGARKDSNMSVFFVRDNGAGIDPRYHEKVFELFTKLDPKSDGTGIGLSLVKRIIALHGGRVWVESEGIGTGSTFCFTLPVLE